MHQRPNTVTTVCGCSCRRHLLQRSRITGQYKVALGRKKRDVIFAALQALRRSRFLSLRAYRVAFTVCTLTAPARSLLQRGLSMSESLDWETACLNGASVDCRCDAYKYENEEKALKTPPFRWAYTHGCHGPFNPLFFDKIRTRSGLYCACAV